MELLITVCARGGSKGIADKNIQPVLGVPLIGYTIDHALRYANKVSADVALSTDGDQIRSIAAEHGLQSDYVRPDDLATDTAGKIAVIRDIVEHKEKRKGKRYDFVLDLDVTSPLRTIQDLDEAYASIQSDPNALNLFSVNPAHRNPYFNMVEQDADGYYKLSKIPETPILSRQTAPKVYDLNASFYFYRREFFELDYKNAYTERSLIYEMPHYCFDIDSQTDFDFLEYQLKHNRFDFDA